MQLLIIFGKIKFAESDYQVQTFLVFEQYMIFYIEQINVKQLIKLSK